MTKLILIRGLPGSGKSTLAKSLLEPGWNHYEADAYHINKNGVYNFDIRRASEAHAWCLDMATDSIESGCTVIVANTFTTLLELKPYLKMAEDYDVPVEVIHCTGQFKTIHGVPEEVIKKMASRWEAYPGEKKHSTKTKGE
jgi:predicted kinase